MKSHSFRVGYFRVGIFLDLFEILSFYNNDTGLSIK